MSPEEIAKKAKSIVMRKTPVDDNCVLEFLKTHEHELFICDDKKYLYNDWYLNNHHYTTEYHRKFVMPKLSRMLDFSYNPDDYELVKNTCNVWDISQLKPKREMRFHVNRLEYGIEYDGNFDDLAYNKKAVKISPWTEYHGLYAFPHSCSIVTNLNHGNGRTLFISGVSQMIPSIPFLCSLFKEVWYFDNRSPQTYKEIINKSYFDDVLVEIHINDIDYYLKNNLK